MKIENKMLLHFCHTMSMVSGIKGWVLFLFFSGSSDSPDLQNPYLAWVRLLEPSLLTLLTSFLPISQLFIFSFSGFQNHQLVTSLFGLAFWFFKKLSLDFNLWYMDSGIFSLLSCYRGKKFSLLSSISVLWNKS